MDLRDNCELIDQLRKELMHARTELAFLLSDQACTAKTQVIHARIRVDELLNRIAMNSGYPSSGCPQLPTTTSIQKKAGADLSLAVTGRIMRPRQEG